MFMRSLESLTIILAEILRLKQTEGQIYRHGSIDSASEPKQEYTYMLNIYITIYTYILYGVSYAFFCLLHTLAQS